MDVPQPSARGLDTSDGDGDAVAALKPEDTTVPALPDDLLRMVWARIWQQDAACIIQRAARSAIARAEGYPWDLPPLVDASDSEEDDLIDGLA